MLVICEGTLIIGIPRGLDVPIIGQIKLLEICNID
jgi:hypothetical protein